MDPERLDRLAEKIEKGVVIPYRELKREMSVEVKSWSRIPW